MSELSHDALTSRWRKLERSGWWFAIARTDVDLTGGVVTEAKRLIGVHPKLAPTLSADIKVPMSKERELVLVSWYEENTP